MNVRIMKLDQYAILFVAFSLQFSVLVFGLSSFEPEQRPRPPVPQVDTITFDDIIRGLPELQATGNQPNPGTHLDPSQHPDTNTFLNDKLGQVYISQDVYRHLFNKPNQKQAIRADKSKLGEKTASLRIDNGIPLLHLINYPRSEAHNDDLGETDSRLRNSPYSLNIIGQPDPKLQRQEEKPSSSEDSHQNTDGDKIPWVQDTYIERALYSEPGDIDYHHENLIAVPHSTFIDPGAVSADFEPVNYVQDFHRTRSSQPDQRNYNTDAREKSNTGQTVSHPVHPIPSVQHHLGTNPLNKQSVNLIGDFRGSFDQQKTQVDAFAHPGHKTAVLSNTYHPHDTESFVYYLPCTEEFYLTYDYDTSGTVWQGVKGHVAVANHEAVFNGQGSLIIPFFACNDLLPRYSMRFTIRPEYTQHDMALLGNSLDPHTSSFQVTVSGYNLKLSIKPRSGWESSHSLASRCFWHWESLSALKVGHDATGIENIVVLSVHLQPGDNTVTIIQEDGHVFLSANDQVAYGQANLPTLTREPLYIGAGVDPVLGTVLPLYKGTFDSFVFEKCPTRLLVNGVH